MVLRKAGPHLSYSVSSIAQAPNHRNNPSIEKIKAKGVD
jgi:hypothetical protein